ncbi:hypothetical protein NW762_010061 [Fusarium torreyae]|uniref:Rhodopsin domain-containing protein n=1 Tax=Fusarium torreyae TaxID=1237075 RepID=A0A9W8RWI9_9HYPO|nr:hypothetical protein NW762_010061 [Fusarium torreyae]
MVPPGNRVSHFDAPWNSLQNGVVISFGVTFALATIFLGLRFFQAIRLVKKFEIDLVIITISYGVSIFYFVTMVNLMHYGWGKHLWDVSLAQLAEFNKGLLPNTLAYLMCPAITKMAMLSVLYRINPSLIYRCTVVAIGVSIFAYTLTLCSITGGPCNPLHAGTTKCLQNVALAQSVLNIASDFAVVAVPIPTIHSLNFSLKQKMSVGCILAVGSGVVICSIARLPYVIVLEHAEDVTYTEAILGVWSIVEINLGIICACAMRFKRLITTYLPRLGGYWSSRSRSTGEQLGSGLQLDPRKGQHSYQLHSVQKSSSHPIVEGKGIQVYRTYKIDSHRRDTDGRSTDEILP